MKRCWYVEVNFMADFLINVLNYLVSYRLTFFEKNTNKIKVE